jgi:pimeloyl-ACP methyl ester carboxylesterase
MPITRRRGEYRRTTREPLGDIGELPAARILHAVDTTHGTGDPVMPALFSSPAPRGASTPRDTLLCLHSSGSSGRQWDPLAAELSARFEVRAPDMHELHAGRDALDDEAQALAQLLGEQGAHLLGHSYGGVIALQMALRWPGKVKSLTLYEPVRFALLFGQAATRPTGEAIVAVGQRIGEEVLAGALHAAAARFMNYWSGEGAWQAISPRARQTLAQRMPKVRADFEALFADGVPAAAYRQLTMPVHLIGGTRSPQPARQVLDILAAQIPQAERSTLAGLGHMGPIEAPHTLLAAMGHPLRMAQAA